jgi:hypothetical protein
VVEGEEDSEAAKLAGNGGNWSAKVSWPMTVVVGRGGIDRERRKECELGFLKWAGSV